MFTTTPAGALTEVKCAAWFGLPLCRDSVNPPRTLLDKIWTTHLVRDLGGGVGLLAIDRVFLHERTGSDRRRST